VITTSMTAVSVSTRSAQSNVSAARLHPAQHRHDAAPRHAAQEARKIGHDSAQEMNSAPVVSDLATVLPSAGCQARDDRGQQRQEDDETSRIGLPR
jgi:hypothetical protein